MPVLLDESVQNYLDWLKNIKNSPYHTYRAYQVDLQQFLRYFLRHDKNEMPSRDDILEYMSEVEKKYTYSTYRRKVTALRNFIAFLVESGVDVPDPFVDVSLPLPEVDYNLPIKYIDVLDVLEMLTEHNPIEVRDKLVFSLLAKSGFTVKQLTCLKVKDINLATNRIIISKDSMTFIDQETNRLIEKHLMYSRRKNEVGLEDYLITNNERLPLSTRTINLIIEKAGKKARAPYRLSPRILRRLFAMNLKEKNVHKETIEMILGKKSRIAGN